LKILLTNDDGIDAAGLDALFAAVTQIFRESVEIVVVAPDRGRSECGHSVTTGRPLKFQRRKADWFAVDGTPVDCVRAALASLAPEVDLVISGVNAGANLGVDLLVSGTFAAAREAAIHGIPAMAVSHYRRPDIAVTWDHVPAWLAETLAEFARKVAEQDQSCPLWNVNLPAINPSSPPPPRVRCGVDSKPLVRIAKSVGERLFLESDFHGRPRKTGSDVELCFAGHITISELKARFE
jgi:5'-nucleotidase